MAPDVPVPTPAATGLPSASDLSPVARIVYEGTVLSDLALRTGVASVLAAAMLPSLARTDRRQERARLEYFAELAAAADRDAVFHPPPDGVRVTTERSGRLPALDGGHAATLSFRSPYRSHHPGLRDDYAAAVPNRTAWAQHWRHDEGPRPTLCVIHGFGASPHWFNTRFFELGWFFAQGYDVLLYTLPFHGRRSGAVTPLDGTALFSRGFAQFNEAMLHAVHDFRVFLDHLEAEGSPRVGVTGLSLGGYTSALLAAVEPRLDFVIPNAPVTFIPQLLREWFPASAALGLARRAGLVEGDLLSDALAVHSPLTYAPLVPKDRRMIIGGLGDRLAPPEQARLLWEHWDRPRLRWFPGSHVLHVGRGTYLREMRDLMREPAAAAAL
jgi:pimeloyl-ACP methyl ester carboxylesterase